MPSIVPTSQPAPELADLGILGEEPVDPPDPRVLFLVGEVPFTLEGTIWKLES